MGVTMQQIAEACGVSRGTVDRALKGKQGIRPEVAERIIQTAKELGYVSNKYKSKKVSTPHFRIGLVLHSASTDYVKQLIKELHKIAHDYFKKNVDVFIRYTQGTKVEHQLKLIDELVQNEHINALGLMPLASDLLRKRMNDLSLYNGIPVVTFNTDISNTSRIAYVGANNLAMGKAAAALLGLCIGGKGKILPIAGQPKGHYGDTQRITGFTEEMERIYPNIQLLEPEYCFNDALLIERVTQKQLQLTPDIVGIYIATFDDDGVYNAVKSLHLQQQVHVVSHDLTPRNIELLKSGDIDFVLGQQLYMQSALPIKILYEYLLKKKKPAQTIITTEIEVKFKYNV